MKERFNNRSKAVKPKMSQEAKELMHKVMDGQIVLVPVIHQLTRYVDHEKFLKWLVINKITGANLLDWIKINFRGSLLEMVKYIIKINNREREIAPIYYGKDWR